MKKLAKLLLTVSFCSVVNASGEHPLAGIVFEENPTTQKNMIQSFLNNESAKEAVLGDSNDKFVACFFQKSQALDFSDGERGEIARFTLKYMLNVEQMDLIRVYQHHALKMARMFEELGDNTNALIIYKRLQESCYLPETLLDINMSMKRVGGVSEANSALQKLVTNYERIQLELMLKSDGSLTQKLYEKYGDIKDIIEVAINEVEPIINDPLVSKLATVYRNSGKEYLLSDELYQKAKESLGDAYVDELAEAKRDLENLKKFIFDNI